MSDQEEITHDLSPEEQKEASVMIDKLVDILRGAEHEVPNPRVSSSALTYLLGYNSAFGVMFMGQDLETLVDRIGDVVRRVARERIAEYERDASPDKRTTSTSIN